MPSSSAYSNLPPNQRISRLEQLLQNLTNMNMPQQINELQHQLQTLNGKLEEQSHQYSNFNCASATTKESTSDNTR